MPIYKIEQKITTVADNAVFDGPEKASFVSEGIKLTHGDFTIGDGWKSNFWYAEMEIESDNREVAYQEFLNRLRRVISRISLIGQCYISYMAEPFVIIRKDKYQEFALFRLVREGGGVGLMFMDEHKRALDLLLGEGKICEEFYLYWNDAVNTTGYSSKLLSMFSSLEALSRKRDKTIYPNRMDLYKKILGVDLALDIFSHNTGIRNRLTHGEYFNENDNSKDYLDLIHKSVVKYFNDEILKEKIIDEDVVHPQRSPYENKEGGGPWFIIKQEGSAKNFTLKDIIMVKDGREELDDDNFLISTPDERQILNSDF